MKKILPERLQDAAVELSPYFWDSMGNPTRIDYGTGHETTFVAWLYCFRLLNLVTPEDYPALVLKVFSK
jgi:serine/threonine-protein phosphatase 2A activator